MGIPMSQKAKASDAISNALKTLFAVAENYPKLQASENFKMLQEELAELIVAVNHMKRGRCGWDKVLEEMGDVEILIDQFKLQDGHLKIINDSKMSKLKRLEERLDAHNKKE